MLTRALALSLAWLVISVVPLLWRGTRARHGHLALSFLWQLAVILAGDLWAVMTFGRAQEVAVASLIALAIGITWIILLPNWNALGQAAWTTSLITTVLFLAYGFAVTAFRPLHPLGFLLSFALFAVESFALCLSLTFLYETLDACTRLRWNHVPPPRRPLPAHAPKVSLHIPAYNEPPEIVEATLRLLARLDYPNFEVLLVDNNTPDPGIWRPLEAVCCELGPNFRCLHLDGWPGYKSGALNFALTQTAPDAEIIGIIDADYQVRPEYLRELVPMLSEPEVAFVQTPQDYRGYEGDAFLEACYDSYKYFFEVPMMSRNEHNAIIFAGTMGLIRKSVLQQIGGWDEWCITEDAEASLRILKLGYRSIYVNRAYGHGIMPLNFEGLKKQRFRWCFGGIQLLRKHWEALMPWARWIDPANRLTAAQRYYYLTSSLQWFNELATLIFTILLLIGGAAVLLGSGTQVRPLPGALVVIPVVSLGLGLWRFLWALRHRLNLGWKRAFRAMGIFFSLSWVVTLASIQGLIQPYGVFLRTPKTKSASNFVRAMQVTQWESGLGLACGLVGLSLAASRPAPGGWIVVIFLIWEAAFYFAAPIYSLLSERGKAAVLVSSRGDIRGRSIGERRAAWWSLVLLPVLLLTYLALRLLPQPTDSPSYTLLEPEPLPEVIVIPQLPTATSTEAPTPTDVFTASPTPTVVLTASPEPSFTATVLATPSPAFTETATEAPVPTESETIAPSATAPGEGTPTDHPGGGPPTQAHGSPESSPGPP